MTGRSRPSRGQPILTLDGALTPFEVPALRRKVSGALEGELHDLVVDLRLVWVVCREALAVLSGANARQRSLHRQLTWS